MHFGMFLLRKGRISGPQFIQAVSRQLDTRPQIGALAIETRSLSMRELFRILSLQCEAKESFGQLAIQLGFLTEVEIRDLLALQIERTTPLAQVFVEIGVLDELESHEELQKFHEEMADRPHAGTLSDSLNIDAIEAAFATYGALV